ncbi:hypothetical protein KCMC57_up59210 [Kitasatospora sp. CMC57]|uniref:YcxB-like C-terminal domain-containing protein n=1 Tax=Kitasatospora sp. CMC57 TaxID=3231513 RepID=A0AB33K776_9ACTN
MNISTSYQVSFADLLRASQLGLRRRRRVLWICAIALVSDGVLLFALGNHPLAAAALLAGAFVLHQLTLGTRKGVRRALAEAAGTTEVELTDDAVTVRRPGLHTEIAWRHYRKVVEDPEFLFLYINRLTFTAVPKRGMTSGQKRELAAFVAALNGTTVRPRRPAPIRVTAAAERTGNR